MTPTELCVALVQLYGEGTDYELAKRAAPHFRVHFRSVIKWLAGDRAIPGPITALVERMLND